MAHFTFKLFTGRSMAHFTFKLFTYKSKSISLWEGEGLGVQMRFWRVFPVGRKWKSLNCFRFIPMHYLSNGIYTGSLSPQPPNPFLADIGADITTSAGFSDTVSGRESISDFSAELRLSRTCDLGRDHGGDRFCATNVHRTGVSTSSRAARTESDLLTGWLRPTLRSGFSIISTSAPLTKMAM